MSTWAQPGRLRRPGRGLGLKKFKPQPIHLSQAAACSNERSRLSEAKTKATSASVEEYLASKASPEQLADCKALMALFKKVTKEAPKMWGPSIVGYGSYSYRYESGRTGESCLTGFAVRGKELVVYLVAEGPEQEALLAKLGEHKMGKACLYFKRLADLDTSILESLIKGFVAETKRRHTVVGGA